MRKDSDRPPSEQPENGSLCGVPDVGGDLLVSGHGAEMRICLGFRVRVSLKSCSGAILDRVVVVVPGVSVV